MSVGPANSAKTPNYWSLFGDFGECFLIFCEIHASVGPYFVKNLPKNLGMFML